MLPEIKKKLTAIGKQAKFKRTIEKLTIGTELTFEEQSYILATAIVFFKYYQKNPKYLSFADISYFIILKYTLQYKDYLPLFDFSLNFGFYPITKGILKENLLERIKLTDIMLNARLDDFSKDNYTETLEQNIRSRNFIQDKSNEKCYLAPTSFGKSSIIIEYIKSIKKDNFKIVIVVPTKSLLMQTYRMVREANMNKKILIHDEMYNDEQSFIAIFTQERSLRLMTKRNLFFDILIIDEAHNLLKRDNGSNREILLARLIAKNLNLNPNHKVIYLSPLINEEDKLRVNKKQNITAHSIKFNIKEPDLYEYRTDKTVHQYNRFVNQFYKIGQCENLMSYLFNNLKNKNFFYHKRPIKIEAIAKLIYKTKSSEIENNIEVNKIISILKKEVHEDFYAVKYLKKGIIYLHGKIPDLIKEYLEVKFKKINEFKYLVANSVILEGMNLPIDNLFIFHTHGASGKELINLIGRVNRLNNVFNQGVTDFQKLIPKIHFINTGDYKYPHTKKIQQLRSRIFKDVTKNPLLDDFDIKNLKLSGKKEEIVIKIAKIKRIQENEKFLYTKPNSEFDKVKQSFIEIDICNYYVNFSDLINTFIEKKNKILNNKKNNWKNKKVLDKIKYIFIDDLELNDFEFARLENEKARNYYDNYLYVSRKMSFKERVNSQLEYFNEIAKKSNREDRLYYIGETYGNTRKYSNKYKETTKEVYVDLAEGGNTKRVNLAIVKLKMEDDFVSFKLNKFIVVMYDYNLITTEEYNEIVYGTTDIEKIELAKYGLNISLVEKLQKDGQISNIYFDKYNNLKINGLFSAYLEKLNDFQRFEIERFIT